MRLISHENFEQDRLNVTLEIHATSGRRDQSRVGQRQALALRRSGSLDDYVLATFHPPPIRKMLTIEALVPRPNRSNVYFSIVQPEVV